MAEGGYPASMAGLEDDLKLSSSSSDSDDHESPGMEGDAEFQEVTSKAEKKRRRDAARLSEDSDNDKMKTAKKSHIGQEERSSGKRDPPHDTTVRSDDSCRRKWTGVAAAASHSRLSE